MRLCIILTPGKTQTVPLGPCNKSVLLLQFQVRHKVIPVGATSEPVYLTIIHGNPAQFSRGFPRDMTFDDFRSCVCDLTQMDFSTVVLKRIVGKESASHVQTLNDSTLTLEGLHFKDGDQIIVEDRNKNRQVRQYFFFHHLFTM